MPSYGFAIRNLSKHELCWNFNKNRRYVDETCAVVFLNSNLHNRTYVHTRSIIMNCNVQVFIRIMSGELSRLRLRSHSRTAQADDAIKVPLVLQS